VDYDANGNVTSITDPLSKITWTQYNSWNEPIKVTDALGNNKDDTQHTTTTAYTDLGQASTVTSPPAANGYASTTQYLYDNLGRKTETIAPDPATGVASKDDVDCPKTFLAYDANGNVISTTEPLNRTTSFANDGLNRRVQTIDAIGNTTATRYDAQGNVIATTDQLGRKATYQYDNLGRTTETIKPDPQTGQPSGSSAITYDGYDLKGNLKFATTPPSADTASQGPGDPRYTTWYFYDALKKTGHH